MGSPQTSSIDRFKQAAADAAAAQIENGMIVGLGSGTTATLAVASIGKRVAEGLKIIGISTSEKTAQQAQSLNIPLATLEEHPAIDLTIDGADEVELGTLNLIKGGGGNLLREKIVAVASARMLVIADERKMVQQLGSRFPLPIEIVPFGWQSTAKRLRELGMKPIRRCGSDGKPYITDGGHYIVDCAYGPMKDPAALQRDLDSIVGVVEHGLFIGIASQALIGGDQGIQTLHRTESTAR